MNRIFLIVGQSCLCACMVLLGTACQSGGLGKALDSTALGKWPLPEFDLPPVDLHRIAYKALRQRDCELNDLGEFCAASAVHDYHDYRRLRERYLIENGGDRARQLETRPAVNSLSRAPSLPEIHQWLESQHAEWLPWPESSRIVARRVMHPKTR